MNRVVGHWTFVGLCAGAMLVVGAPSARTQAEHDWPEAVAEALQPPPWLAFTVPVPPAAAGELVLPDQDVRVAIGDLLSGIHARFRIRLLDGEVVTVVRDSEDKRDDGRIWFGHIQSEASSSVILSVVGQSLSGSIRSPWHPAHVIEPVGHGRYRLRIGSHEPIHCQSRPQPMNHPDPVPPCQDCDDPKSHIDVAVLYTPASLEVIDLVSYTMTDDEMEALVYECVALTNKGLADSQLSMQLSLVHVAEQNFTEQFDLEAAVQALAVDPAVAAIRDDFGADIVVMIVSDGNQNGRSLFPSVVSESTCDLAFAVVVRSHSVLDAGFPHEVGHLFGADHHCDDPGIPDTGKNHGFNCTSPTPCPDHPVPGPWATVMSEATDTHERVVQWSNPEVRYPLYEDEDDADCGDFTGSDTGSCLADNAAVLDAAAEHVANYRCWSPSREDIWTKDTWDDTGEEPNPTTGVMHRSPYIWVRNQRDSGFLHQHEHENPVRNVPNWIYVKLHNGFDLPQDGTLHLYSADAETSIEWDAGWPEITPAIGVTGFAANSTLIVEKEWTPGTGSTHFCLLARWDSNLDPPHDEGTDVSANVRKNNNLAWKNLTIADLVASDMASAAFMMRNPPDPGPGPEDDDDDDDERRVSLRIRPAKPDLRLSFISAGRVYVRLSPELMEAWVGAERKGRGFRWEPQLPEVNRERNLFLLTDPSGASFEFDLAPGSGGQVEVDFQRLPGTPKRDYLLDFEELVGHQVVGGVSHEIRCTRRGH